MQDTKEPIRVLMTQRVPEPAIAKLRQGIGSEGILEINPDPDRIWTKAELIEKLKERDYNALYCLLTNSVDAEVLDAAPNLRIVANMAVGFNNVDVQEATRRGIAVSNTPGVLTDTTADFAWALLMAVARRVVEADHFLREGRYHGWGPMMLMGQDVHRKVLGVIGFGRIGQTVAKRATGFEMDVLYYDRYSASREAQEALNAYWVTLEVLLQNSDFVTIHTDYNPETHHLIGAKELVLMKPTAYLINTARGPIVDEDALVEALKGGQIAGAALDVFEREPEVHPGLLGLPNVVLAPHIASASVETRTAMATTAVDNILALFSGEPLPTCVNPDVLSQE